MKNPESIHPLAQKNKLSGKIVFIHTDGKTHSFNSVVNEMTGDRMTYFDNNPPAINMAISAIRDVFLSIRKYAKVIEFSGDF